MLKELTEMLKREYGGKNEKDCGHSMKSTSDGKTTCLLCGKKLK